MERVILDFLFPSCINIMGKKKTSKVLWKHHLNVFFLLVFQFNDDRTTGHVVSPKEEVFFFLFR